MPVRLRQEIQAVSRQARVAATSQAPVRIRVAAGILRDNEGRVLLAERINDNAFRGLWEFPGGKIDASEAPEAGLCRELAEELDIVVTKLEHLASVEHDYPDRLVHIDFFLVTEWCDEIRAMDGQALRWVRPENIDTREILPADIEIVEALTGRSLAQPRKRPL
jgi:8-oxo-dGTP diphosphatase